MRSKRHQGQLIVIDLIGQKHELVAQPELEDPHSCKIAPFHLSDRRIVQNALKGRVETGLLVGVKPAYSPVELAGLLHPQAFNP